MSFLERAIDAYNFVQRNKVPLLIGAGVVVGAVYLMKRAENHNSYPAIESEDQLRQAQIRGWLLQASAPIPEDIRKADVEEKSTVDMPYGDPTFAVM